MCHISGVVVAAGQPVFEEEYMSDRIANAQLRSKVMTADEAAQFVNHGDKVGISGFTGAGYPKVLPTAIAERAKEAHAKGDEFMIDLFTGASTAPDCDGVLAEADAVRFRTPACTRTTTCPSPECTCSRASSAL